MNKEQLSKFSDPEHHKIFKPFSFGDFTYASNGHLLVRVPRLDDCEEWESLNEQAARMFETVDMPLVLAALVDIPDFPQPEPKKCSACKGTGKITLCPECEGKGYVEFANDYSEYECDCETCHGHGSTIGDEHICESCNGTGHKKKMTRIELGCAGFSSHYLNMLNELPGMKIAPTEPNNANYFKWDCGDGLIMPMRA